jgi:hypothetical protein
MTETMTMIGTDRLNARPHDRFRVARPGSVSCAEGPVSPGYTLLPGPLVHRSLAARPKLP